MASASWALLPGGEICSILIHDICLRCDGPVSREAAMEKPCTRFFVLVPALFLFSHTKFHNFCVSLYQLFFWISLSLCFSPFWWFRVEDRHLSVMSRERRRKRHPRPSSCRATRLCWNWAAAAQRHHQVAERPRWAWGWRCSVITSGRTAPLLWW